MLTSQVEVPSNVDCLNSGTLQHGTAHMGRYLATLECTSGTLQVYHCARPLTQHLKRHFLGTRNLIVET